MIFMETALKGAYIIEIEPIEDERGFFARTWCQQEFKTYGLHTNFVQCNLSYNRKKGTRRGMHFQFAPFEEIKLIRCSKGAIFDVIIDIRPESHTYRQWISVELTDRNNKMLYIPKGFAHGFQTLEDDTEVFYQMSEFYQPEHVSGIRFDDPEFGVSFPDIGNVIISEKDKSYPRYRI